MKTSRKVGMAAGAAAFLLAFSLWNFSGGWKAADMVPEKVPAPEEAISGADRVEPEGTQLYDSGGYARKAPLSDPFQAGPAERPRQDRKGSGPAGGERKPEGPAPERTGKTEERGPVLQGIIAAGARKRAIIQWNGKAHIAGEGEQVGLWTVKAIQEKQAVLAGPSGEKVLSLSRGGLDGVSP